MRAEDLRLDRLLEAPPDGGVLTFAGGRVLLFDAVALGLLRRQLVELLGQTAARGLLTRFGYSHGWRTAETLRDAIPWDDEREWRIAGGRLHRLQGLVTFESVPAAEQGDDPASAAAIWHDSYEAEQHLLHLGPSDEPVCWTLTGFASGYLSRVTGRAVYCVEETCVARGDAVCRMVGRPKEEWGAAIEPHLPFYERECIDAALEALRHELRATEARVRLRRRALASVDAGVRLVGDVVVRSQALRDLVERADRVAHVDTTVLVTGESGSGKERIARLLHDHSLRAAGPFVAVNSGALPETLLESELFGHAKGAFTGATGDRAGLFEAAHGGTLFLDEVGELTPALQVKLLRVVEQRTVRRVGESRERPIDVRIVAATNRDLLAEVAAGRFREDLYYRLRVVELHVPALRERRDDILPLAHHFVDRARTRLGRTVQGLTPAASEHLLRQEWPGNVRELQNAIEHAVVFATGDTIDVGDLPKPTVSVVARAPASGTAPVAMPESGSEQLEDVERAHVLAVLERTGGNKAAAARRLGIGTATMFRKLKRWGVG